MAYKALYRTYRPDNFEEMAGQKHIVKTLNNAIERNQIAHAYLFCGPRGTGKTSSAKIFAKAINCESDTNKPCGICPNCIAASNGTHSDIIEIDAASNNGVEEARNLIEKVKYAPLLGKYKVYIIDEVHMMSTGAFNALLKTIEEPPAHVIFILATTEPHKVIPTIISRCQRFDFSKITKQEIVKALQKVVDKEQINVEDKVLDNIAILADGGMRDALSILDQCRAYSPSTISLQDVRDIYGVVSTQEVCDILQHIKQKDVKTVMNEIEALDRSGADIKRLTMDLVEVLKESIIYDYAQDDTMLSIVNIGQVTTLKENTTTATRLQMIDILVDTYDKYKFASNVISYFEIGLLKMMELFKQVSIPSLAKQETIVEETKQIVPQASVEETKQEEVKLEIKEETKEEVKLEIKEEVNTTVEEPTYFELDEQEDIIETIEEVVLSETIQMDSPVEEVEEQQPIEDEIVVTPPQEVKETKEVKCLSQQYIIQLLVGANKPEKLEDVTKMQDIQMYALDMKYAKYANLLKNCNIIASAKQYIILCVETVAKANEINDLDKNSEFLDFTLELFKKKKKIFALVPQQRDEAIDEFVRCQKEGRLPEPIAFEFKEEVKQEDEKLTVIKSLFQDIEIKED